MTLGDLSLNPTDILKYAVGRHYGGDKECTDDVIILL